MAFRKRIYHRQRSLVAQLIATDQQVAVDDYLIEIGPETCAAEWTSAHQ